MGQTDKNSSSSFPWKEFFTFLGVIVAAYVCYLGIRSQIEIPIHATQTAEVFRATQTVEANLVTSITVVPTNTAESISDLPTLIPTPTSWLLGNNTAIDPQALCSITVNDFQETNMKNVKQLRFAFTGQGGYCSWILPLNGYNATSKSSVAFWIRGEKGGEKYEVGLKDTKTLPGQEPKVLGMASADWTQVFVSLNSFKDQNLASLENFSLNFKDGSGTIYISQLIFTP